VRWGDHLSHKPSRAVKSKNIKPLMAAEKIFSTPRGLEQILGGGRIIQAHLFVAPECLCKAEQPTASY